MHTHMHGSQARTTPPAAARAEAQDLYVRGLLALRSGDAEAAASLLTRALRRAPAHQGMRRNLLRALLAAEHFEPVVAQATAALTDQPDDAELHFIRGTALNALGHPVPACAAFTRALTLQPAHAPTWLNMGNARVDLEDLVSAEALYRTAIRLDSTLAEAHASLGHVLTLQGRTQEALAACETAIRLRPDFAQGHWNLAIAALLSGDLARGFAEYEWRRSHARYGADFPPLPGPMWDGTSAAGRTILVRAEQGAGDVIQFARYLTMIRGMGATPVLVCAASLVPLIRRIEGVQAVAAADPRPRHDAWIDQASLPRLFGTTLATIPNPDAYLTADPARTQAWRDRLPPGPKVGITLVGNPAHPADRRRSVPPGFAVHLPPLEGVHFVSLQHGAATDRLGLPDLTAWLTDYAETAALIAALDLVITVDTSVAHLAGAMGKPVWILLPHAPDWRWLLGRDDSPWYRSVRLFRQPAPGDWAGVFDRVFQELRAVSTAPGETLSTAQASPAPARGPPN